MDLNQAVIAITGGARGLGLGMAKILGSKGATITIIDIQKSEIDQAVSTLNTLGINASGYCCNVADEAQVDQIFSQITAEHGELNALINNAGILRDSLLLKTKEGKVTNRMSIEQ